MNFTTKIPIQKNNFPIDYSSNIVLLGSCFAENIGEKFNYFKFQTVVNPFGIIFNIVSIENLVDRAINKIYFTEDDIFFHNDLWHCYEIHSQLSNPDKEIFLENLNQLIESTNNQIHKLTHCIITLGTSWVYKYNANNQIVANCHKVLQKEFTKELLSVETIQKSIKNIVDLIQSINPKCNFIFTVSPVRHIKDGFFENNVSKAHLISAVYKTVNSKRNSVNYFPSYEIMIDELRDYRFYKQDMLHPNETAIDYIWEKFVENYFSPQTIVLATQVEAIQKALAHKPFNVNTENHQKFLQNIQDNIKALQSKIPNLEF